MRQSNALKVELLSLERAVGELGNRVLEQLFMESNATAVAAEGAAAGGAGAGGGASAADAGVSEAAFLRANRQAVLAAFYHKDRCSKLAARMGGHFAATSDIAKDSGKLGALKSLFASSTKKALSAAKGKLNLLLDDDDDGGARARTHDDVCWGVAVCVLCVCP